MKSFSKIIILFFFISCMSEKPTVKIDVLSDYEFALNEERYSINQFKEVFKDVSEATLAQTKGKYDIVLRVYEGVQLKTIHEIKVEFSKNKKHIDQIKYSHED